MFLGMLYKKVSSFFRDKQYLLVSKKYDLTPSKISFATKNRNFRLKSKFSQKSIFPPEVITFALKSEFPLKMGIYVKNIIRYKARDTKHPFGLLYRLDKWFSDFFIHRTLHPGKIYPVTK